MIKAPAAWLAFAVAQLMALPGRSLAQVAVGDTVFVVPGSHLDIGFTAPIDVVRARRVAIIDQAIAAAERDPTFVWFEEGGWSVEAWLDHYRNQPSHVAELRALIRRHQFGIGATMLSPYAAGFPEALPLLTMHLDRVQRELGVRPTVAVVNDVPAVPESFVDMLAAAGIRYLLMAPNLVFSAPLPASVTRSPFYWQSAHGARVLVAIDTNGYSAALTRWWLPPACIRALDPQQFPSTVSDDQILMAGVGNQLARHAAFQPLGVIQQALDNGDAECAMTLPAALRQWNTHSSAVHLQAATPDVFFDHLAARLGAQLPTRRGEWGADWDLLRMSEPVWSWRLRTALHAITATSPYALRLAAVTVADHNMGLGPRWMDGLSEPIARGHIAAVASLYHDVVAGAVGTNGLSAVPASIPLPTGKDWPRTWLHILGDRHDVARVRAGAAFLFPFVAPDAPAVNTPVTVAADDRRVVIHTAIDRVALERQIGARYQAVIDITLHAPIGQLHIAAEDSPDARDGRWLLGRPASHIVSPAGVRVAGPGWTITAHGPLLIGWSLVADPTDPGVTRLQALALVHAVAGVISNHQTLRLPFAKMYPGEPAVPAFDLEIDRVIAVPRTGK